MSGIMTAPPIVYKPEFNSDDGVYKDECPFARYSRRVPGGSTKSDVSTDSRSPSGARARASTSIVSWPGQLRSLKRGEHAGSFSPSFTASASHSRYL